MRIVTRHVYPPIPARGWDWSAEWDDYDPSGPIGWGTTEQAAIADLLTETCDLDPALHTAALLQEEWQ